MIRSGFFAGQVGCQIRLDTQDDAAYLAAATKLEIHYRRPTFVTGTWTATLDGTELVYTTTTITDLSVAGEWIVQAYLEGPGWKTAGEKVVMLVDEPIRPIS